MEAAIAAAACPVDDRPRAHASGSAVAHMTPLRRATLAALRQTLRPLSAYELMERLERSLARRIAPPTVYRALNFLCRTGLAARIESRNAFVARKMPSASSGGVFFICGCCGSTQEVGIPDLDTLLDDRAAALGVRVERRIMELEVLCADCVSAAADRPSAAAR